METPQSDFVDVTAGRSSRADLNRPRRLYLSPPRPSSAGLCGPLKFTLCWCKRGKRENNNNNSYSPFAYQWGDGGEMCGFFFVLGLPEMSATHTGGHQRRWQRGGGLNADAKSWKEREAKTSLTARTRPQRHMCKQTAECTAMPGQQ